MSHLSWPMYPPPLNQKTFLFKVRFGLADVPPPHDWKKSSKNEMFVYGLHSTSDDQPSDLRDESRPKCKKGILSH